jgi:uncharacterized lipoprotein YddW (UPF0748 family)
MRIIISTLLLLILFSSIASQEKLPKVAREFRGLWIATVSNLDFPSRQDLSAEQQKAELIKLLDLAVELRMNAVIFQVRSMGDAVYLSELEPSSPFLTGQAGKKLDFDPLKFLIDEAHARGIVVHAWFNPYRASHGSVKTELPENHVSKRHPEWIREYNTYKMLDPGLREAQDYLLNVISDVVRRYDIDGVHFDDYFYPYPDSKQTDFPDGETYEAYKKSGGKLGKDDWRRKNVDDFIQTVSIEIKKIKPRVMFGISPFGVWKQNDTLGITCGTCSYDVLYADGRKWLQEGWVDYFSPQLYWSTSKTGQQFPTLLKWWHGENKKKRHLWVGLAPYKIGDANYPDFSSKEIETQIGMTRTLLTDSAGAVHFRALSLAANKDNVMDSLKTKIYNINAIIPESPWIDSARPEPPQLDITKDAAKNILVAGWRASGQKEAFRWIFYWKIGEKWSVAVLPAGQTSAETPTNLGITKFAVVSVDRLGNLSEATIKEVK